MIEKLSDIDYNSGAIVYFLATVLNIICHSEPEKKRPCKFNIKLEASGENVQVSTWNQDVETIANALVESNAVFVVEAQALNSEKFGPQLRVGSLKDAGMKSSRKILDIVSPTELSKEINLIVKKYIPLNSIYYNFIKELILNNEKFFKWPAATKIHHNYTGGLAKHSLNVCRNAISIWETYSGNNINIELLVAGSLLHDIGKLDEYSIDGSRTKFGDLIPHPVSGADKVTQLAIKLNLNPNDDKLILLKHILISHHDLLEYGASTRPNILEAVIVSKADNLDASLESGIKELSNLNKGENTERLLSLDGIKLLKWN